jgi:hypothetical protein
MKHHYHPSIVIILIITLVGLSLSACATATSPAAIPTAQPVGETPGSPVTASTPTTQAAVLPIIRLHPGDFYFSVDGKPGFIYSRNVGGYKPVHYERLMDWSQAGGTTFVRIQLDSMGMGYTKQGGVDETWALQWEQVFDKAEADGIYILPVFSGWFDWYTGTGYTTWPTNPLNQVNGGPVKSPAELFQKDSATQKMWLDWLTAVVKRWQGRNNIIAWEIFSEVNLASGATETAGIDFIDLAAAKIRSADTQHRPVTASLADDGKWPKFYREAEIDFIQVHPYPTTSQLDREIVRVIRESITRYERPVLIGESGVAYAENYPENAEIGVRHAIWAAMVSGAMNGRALYWEDGFGIFFPKLGASWMEKFKSADLPAATFVKGVDFSGFKPLTSTPTSGVWGAAVGDEAMVLGWFRDAKCEPPDWDLESLISGQSVTISVPGTVTTWIVDFYNTKTGWRTLSPITVTRQGGTITIPLPDFQDSIAFKMNPAK